MTRLGNAAGWTPLSMRVRGHGYNPDLWTSRSNIGCFSTKQLIPKRGMLPRRALTGADFLPTAH